MEPNYFPDAQSLRLMTEGVPNLNDRLFKALGDGYPKGYWGCTVVARDIEQEEWVVRFDPVYEGWVDGWCFNDACETELQFQRTGREIVYFGAIECGDEFYTKS